jgi:hypothetical protein
MLLLTQQPISLLSETSLKRRDQLTLDELRLLALSLEIPLSSPLSRHPLPPILLLRLLRAHDDVNHVPLCVSNDTTVPGRDVVRVCVGGGGFGRGGRRGAGGTVLERDDGLFDTTCGVGREGGEETEGFVAIAEEDEATTQEKV